MALAIPVVDVRVEDEASEQTTEWLTFPPYARGILYHRDRKLTAACQSICMAAGPNAFPTKSIKNWPRLDSE